MHAHACTIVAKNSELLLHIVHIQTQTHARWLEYSNEKALLYEKPTHVQQNLTVACKSWVMCTIYTKNYEINLHSNYNCSIQ